ncbi:MAG: GTPase Era [Acidobacteriota bacterium]|nr:GTPase Era [Acidobacteriota bacterium]MDE3030193.1 GTPase Era [Acidobacteriota bacterium]MDE3093828.1 GTPase Era [Acidobacteriota bacterium]MDE3138580.1 GTPase Era [Acidobacteriota bacterium]MDE3146311.1 GTPase Era [Acidobacteriota bacterium]
MRRSGFAAVIGRPNVGKSTLVNQVVGTKVTITSASPNTTRSAIRGILTENDVQVVFVDTPGIHRPKTSLGNRLNETARASVDGVEVIVAVIEAGKEIGPGDRNVIATMLEHCRRPGGPHGCVVVNKVDRTARDVVAAQLVAAHEAVSTIAREKGANDALERVDYFAVSAKTGAGAAQLVEFVRGLMPEGEFLFPADEVSDVPEAMWVAELVREQLVRKTKQELPHSIHTRVIEFEWPHITVEIVVERESQKGMVIGKGGQLLKDVGIAARRQLPEGCYLELKVSVEASWQKRDDVMDRFGI